MSTRTIESTTTRLASARPAVSPRCRKPVPAEITSPWTGRQSPCTAAEELALVAELELLADRDADVFERRDVTVLITALRGGLTADELFGQAPGASPARLLAAHRELENRRALAEAAWRTVALDPSPETFELFGACAGQLLPAVVSHLATYRHDAHRLTAAIEDAAESVIRTSRRVLVLEQRLAQSTGDPARARELGTLLYDVYGQGAWSLPTFLPPRVGALVPLRLGALLGDDIASGRRAS